MQRPTPSILLLGAVLALAPGCQINERLSGTMFGGVAGAGVGALAGGLGGAAIGAAGGALVGYLIGDYTADQRERGRSDLFGDAGSMGGPASDGGMYARAPVRRPLPPRSVARATPRAPTPAPERAAPAPYHFPPMVAGLKVTAAEAAYQQGRRARTSEEARRHYLRSLQLDPTQPAVHNALGLHDLFAGKRASAAQRFRTALRYDPGNFAAKHNLRKMGVTGF